MDIKFKDPKRKHVRQLRVSQSTTLGLTVLKAEAVTMKLLKDNEFDLSRQIVVDYDSETDDIIYSQVSYI